MIFFCTLWWVLVPRVLAANWQNTYFNLLTLDLTYSFDSCKVHFKETHRKNTKNKICNKNQGLSPGYPSGLSLLLGSPHSTSAACLKFSKVFSNIIGLWDFLTGCFLTSFYNLSGFFEIHFDLNIISDITEKLTLPEINIRLLGCFLLPFQASHRKTIGHLPSREKNISHLWNWKIIDSKVLFKRGYVSF